MTKPGFLGYPPPPIAFAPGHEPGCFDGRGNYRTCVPGCPANRDWGKLQDEAYAAHDAAWVGMRGAPPDRGEEPRKPRPDSYRQALVLRDRGWCGHITAAVPSDVGCILPIGHDDGVHEPPAEEKKEES